MKCKKVQEQLVTEYVDEELGPEENAKVERHLAGCADCRDFLEAVRKTAVAPFKEAQVIEPGDHVWEKIREGIEAGNERSADWFGKLADVLTHCLRVPMPVLRVAFVAALIFVTVTLMRWPANYADPVYNYVAEQAAFMGELRAGNTDLMNGDLKDDEVFFEEMAG